MIKLFFSYSHKDEALKNELEYHLASLKRQNVIFTWHDRRILPGEEFAREIDQHLETSQIILLMISSYFIASDYCYGREMERALDLHHMGKARAVPVILQPCDWRGLPFGKLKVLPNDGKAVSNYPNLHEAFLEITLGIRAVAEEINSSSQLGSESPGLYTGATYLQPPTRSTPSASGSNLNVKFASEAILQQALAGLLTRMPGITGVQILQGSGERVKELVFSQVGSFGEPFLCACIVKNSLTESGTDKSGAISQLLVEARHAFNSQYTDGTSRHSGVQLVYIVTPFNLTPSTIESVRAGLKDRASHAVFIGGSELFDLFKKHWPTFIADEASTIDEHIRGIRVELERDRSLGDLAAHFDLGIVTLTPQSFYVPQMFYRELTSLEVGDSLIEPLLTSNPNAGEATIHTFTKKRAIITLRLSVLATFINRLTELQRVMDYVADWEAVILNGGRARQEVTQILVEVVAELRSQVQKQINPERKPDDQTVPVDDQGQLVHRTLMQQGADPFIRVNNTLLREQFYTLVKMHQSVLLELQTVIKIVDAAFKTDQAPAVTLLSKPMVQRAGNIDSCARAAPEGAFIPLKTFRMILPKNILDQWQGHLMIVGAPGFGKTSFCRWNALRDAERFSTGNSDVIPVYVPLHQLSKRPLGSFKDLFLPNLGQSALIVRNDLGLRDSEIRIRLYLDGLDEVVSKTRRRELMMIAKAGVLDDPRYQVILTARDHVYGSWLDWMFRISLGEFDQIEIAELVGNWLGRDSEDYREFFSQLNSASPLEKLMHTPLLSTLVVLLFKRTGRLPENKTRLYEMWVELLSGRWDAAKGIVREPKFEQKKKLAVLTTLACRVHTARQSSFGVEDLEIAIQETLSFSGDGYLGAMLNELLEDGLISRNGNYLYFPHLSFQEFLTAQDIMLEPASIRADSLLSDYLYGDDWWKEVLKFYIGLTRKPKKIIGWLMSEMDRHGTRVEEGRTMNVLRGFAEAYPEFTYSDVARFIPMSFRSDRLAQQLRQCYGHGDPTLKPSADEPT